MSGQRLPQILTRVDWKWAVYTGLIIGSLLPAVPARAASPCNSEVVVPKDQRNLRADCRIIWDFFEQLDDAGSLDDPGPGMWGSNTHLSSWDGIIVDATIGRITALQLQDKNLIGTIPPQLSLLTNLHELDLSYNKLTGTIPPQLNRLTELRKLHLGYNELTGTIPPHLSRLTNLEDLTLFLNQLTGTIPPQLGGLTNLKLLSFSHNQLYGTIPIQLAKLVSLERL